MAARSKRCIFNGAVRLPLAAAPLSRGTYVDPMIGFAFSRIGIGVAVSDCSASAPADWTAAGEK